MCVKVNKKQVNKLWLLYFHDSLAEAERKFEEAIESNAKLEKEKFYLNYCVHILQGNMQELEEMISDLEMKCDAIKQLRQFLH